MNDRKPLSVLVDLPSVKPCFCCCKVEKETYYDVFSMVIFIFIILDIFLTVVEFFEGKDGILITSLVVISDLAVLTLGIFSYVKYKNTQNYSSTWGFVFAIIINLASWVAMLSSVVMFTLSMVFDIDIERMKGRDDVKSERHFLLLMLGFYCVIMPWMCYLVYLTFLYVKVIYDKRRELATLKKELVLDFEGMGEGGDLADSKKIGTIVEEDEDIQISNGPVDEKRSDKSLENSFDPMNQA